MTPTRRTVLLSGCALSTRAAPPDTIGAIESGTTEVNVIISRRMFPPVHHADAVAAMQIWLREAGRDLGTKVDPRIGVSESSAQTKSRLEAGQVDIMVIDVGEYLEIEASGLAVPRMAGSRNPEGGPHYSYLLVTGRGEHPRTLESLANRAVLHYSRTAAGTALAWIEAELGRQKLGRAHHFFGSFTAVEKPQACVLPVFFSKADACVVDEVNFALLAEVNPQLARLQVAARSAPILEGILAVRANLPAGRLRLFDKLLSLHESPRGKQLLTVFKANRVTRIGPADLDSTRRLWAAYRRATGPAGGMQ